jgi:putative transcriptional regulator
MMAQTCMTGDPSKKGSRIPQISGVNPSTETEILNMHSHRMHGSAAMDALLAGYAAGTLPRALHALIGAHLELQPANRGYVKSLEASLASEMERGASEPVAHRGERLSAIFGIGDQVREVPVPPAGDPRSLVHFCGMSLDDIPCKAVIPGVQEHRFELEDGVRAILYRIRPGKKMPQHTHDGAEVTLVIRGAFADSTGRYGRGDVAITDEEIDHTPVAEAGEECICFAVLDAPVKLTGPVGRWFNRFVKH